MPDAWLEWDDDFKVSATGGLLLCDGDDFARQRIIRRLMTAVGGYVWHKNYGAGLPQRIGRSANLSILKSIVSSQIALESSVAPSPPAQVSVARDGNNLDLIYITIKYTDAASGEPVTLQFTP